jgi:hypothetical protein
MAARLDLTVESDARSRALELLARSAIRRPVLCLLKGRVGGEAEGRWTWGIYSRKGFWSRRINSLLSGQRLLFDLDGLVVAIPQFQYLRELPGSRLAVRGGKLVLLPQSGGA